jgi:integrase
MQYAQRSRHGIWRYRRAIPQALRAIAGKREFIVSLKTRSETEAQEPYLKAHGDAERYLHGIALLSTNAPPVTSDRAIAERGRAYLQQIGMPYVPLADLQSSASTGRGPSELEQRLTFVEDQLGINVDDPETRDDDIAANWRARAVLGTLPVPQFNLSDALAIYLEHKAPSWALLSPKRAKRSRLLVEGIFRSLTLALEGDKPLVSITRRDVRVFREFLLARSLATGTVNKYIQMAGTVWTVASRDIGLTVQNPFDGHAIAEVVHARDRRDVLTKAELAALLQRRVRMNTEIATILMLLSYTGARLAEITGLRCSDVIEDIENGGGIHIIIQPNEIRSLKNLQSRRKVPVLGDALACLKAYLAQRQESKSIGIFQNYGRDGGASAASTLLLKHLRAAGISEKTKVIHSLRHTIKQALRDVGCPVDVSNAIQGHTSGHVSESYGSGHSIAIMETWLTQAYKTLDLQ